MEGTLSYNIVLFADCFNNENSILILNSNYYFTINVLINYFLKIITVE